MTQADSLLLAALFAVMAVPAAAAGNPDTCEWRKPAADPFTGDVPGAVDHYTDIPAATRERLKARMQRFAYDDIVAIRRDSIEGNHRYEPALRGMHFGKQRICGEVTRKTWQPDHEERGLAYCEDGQCIVVPLICRNVSRIVRKPAVTAMGGPGAPAGGSTEPLTFEPPAAGLPPPEAGPTARPQLADPPAISRVTPSLDPVPPSAMLPPALETPAPPPVAGPPSLPSLPPPSLPQLPPPSLPPIPEPSTLLLWAAGLAAGVLWHARRRGAGSLLRR